MKSLGLALLASISAAPLWAQETREMDAHVHGVSTVELAVEDGRVEINLTAPGMDIVGFEYAASSEADKDAVEAAIRVLITPENLVTLPDAAGCRLAEVLAHLHSGDHDDEDHAHEEGEHNDHAEGEEHEAGAGHSEFHVRYIFACEKPAELTAINFPFFAAFENAQEIEAQYVTDAGAGSAEIGRDAAELTLNR